MQAGASVVENCKTFIAGSIPAVASALGFREVWAEVSRNRAEVCGPEVCLRLAGEELAEACGLRSDKIVEGLSVVSIQRSAATFESRPPLRMGQLRFGRTGG